MGEVYRARDTQLGRDVAIKVLSEGLEDAQLAARFEREARALAALSHPNVATLHGFERSAEIDGGFLVMELVEGDDLAEVIARGSLSVDETRGIFLQIAEGLEAAHEAGLVHRDLKPGNVRVTEEGRVKILDFGLARAMNPSAVSGSDLDDSPTLAQDLTLDGALLGTAPYMSPEQARGQAVDKRADIWAYGCCLFEALTGERPFGDRDVAGTLAQILTAGPDWSKLPDEVPAPIGSLVRRCLEKNPRERLRDIGEARVLLRRADSSVTSSSGSSHRSAEFAAGGRRSPGFPWPVAAGVIALLTAGLIGWSLRSTGDEASRPSRLALAAPAGKTFLYRNAPTIDISEDGRLIASSHGQMYVRDLDGDPLPRLVEGTLEWLPFFSPDSSWLGSAGAALTRTALDGDEVRTIFEIDGLLRGVHWSADDSIFYASNLGGGGVYQVNVEGGDPVLVTRAQAPEFHSYPQLLPDGVTLIYTVFSPERDPSIVASRIDTDLGEAPRVLRENAFYARYVETGHLLYAEVGSILAVPFDPKTLELGAPVRVLDDVITSRIDLFAEFDVAREGSLIYLTGTRENRNRIVRLRPDEPPEVLTEMPAFYDVWRVEISPDQRFLALSMDGHREVVVFDIAHRRVRQKVGRGSFPVWHPDGDELVWLGSSLMRARIDRTDSPEEVLRPPPESVVVPWSWSADGRDLVLYVERPDENFDLYTYDLAANELRPLLQLSGMEIYPAISPDSRWVAYTTLSEENGLEVRLTTYPQGDTSTLVDLGFCARWSDDGTLFYFQEHNVMRVRLRSEGSRAVTTEPELFVRDVDDQCSWDVAPDGSHVIAIEKRKEPSLILVTDWLDELERLVPRE